ncbi:hypothetical protein KKH23_10950, partial [Patescibacteria group bacterium]|nr:hypothetical protein [Patescibacteria group bacterium]
DIELTLAGALWREDEEGTYLRWCAIFPEHQGHIHHLYYDKAVLDNDGRDILFYRGGELVAGVVPYIESNLPADDVHEALARWKDAVAQDMYFDEFLAEA